MRSCARRSPTTSRSLGSCRTVRHDHLSCDAKRLDVLSLLWFVTRLVVFSRRSIAALFAYVAIVAVLYAEPGPLAEAYVPTSAALVVITAWLVVAGVSSVTADRSTAHLLAAAARGPQRLHVLLTAAGVVAALPLIAVSLLGGQISAAPPKSWTIIIVGLAAHLVAALVGAGIGAVAAGPVVGEPALVPAVVLAGFVLVTVVAASSPVGPSLRLLRAVGEPASYGLAALGARCAVWCLLAVGWAGVLAVIGGWVAERRRSYGTNAAG
jgi:hypothetical protein